MTGKENHRSANASAGAAAPEAKFSLISDEKLISLYASMVKCRLLDERLHRLARKKGFADEYCSAAGREAAVVSAAIDLCPGDSIRSSGPGLIAGFVKGAPLFDLIRQLNSAGRDGLSAQKAPAISDEDASKKGKAIAVAVAFRAESSSSNWRREMRLAGKERIPVLFVSHRKRLSGPARGISGIPRIPVDGNDVVAVYRVASEAITQARKGNGPTLIECVSAGASNSHKKIRRGPNSDPIQNMEVYLRGKGLFCEGLKKEIEAEFNCELDAAFAAAGIRGSAGRMK
jgi:TPP-dependent pyruvate/acetoin dehydrogenase alpha subunit